jgi:hypothetical protein
MYAQSKDGHLPVHDYIAGVLHAPKLLQCSVMSPVKWLGQRPGITLTWSTWQLYSSKCGLQ